MSIPNEMLRINVQLAPDGQKNSKMGNSRFFDVTRPGQSQSSPIQPSRGQISWLESWPGPLYSLIKNDIIMKLFFLIILRTLQKFPVNCKCWAKKYYIGHRGRKEFIVKTLDYIYAVWLYHWKWAKIPIRWLGPSTKTLSLSQWRDVNKLAPQLDFDHFSNPLAGILPDFPGCIALPFIYSTWSSRKRLDLY